MHSCLKKLPFFKFYKNRGFTPADRRSISNKISFKGTIDTETDREDIMNEFLVEINAGIEHRVDPVDEAFIADLANNNPQKVMVHYLFDDERGVSPMVQAVSTDPWIRDDFLFVSVKNPSDRILPGKVKSLPLI